MFSLSFSGQYLPSLAGTPNRVTICQGTGTAVSCGSDSIIAVADIQYGTKLTTTCGLGNTSTGCCDYDGLDCLVQYSGTFQQEQCSGRYVCTFGDSIPASDTSSCGVANYPVVNHYLTMDYYCLLSKSSSFWNTIRVEKGLDQDQDRRTVGPDLGSNCLQRLSKS